MKPMYEIFYRALGGKVQSKDGLSNIVQRQTGGAASLPPLTTEPMLPPPPPPKTIYDPVREIEAERRARELQTRKIAELGTAPQTRAEREALQARGGFYRDEEWAVRDAMGNIQEDFGFNYVAPPAPAPFDPPDTPDTPAPDPVIKTDPIPTTPLPFGFVRDPLTGVVTIDPEGAKQGRYQKEAYPTYDPIEQDPRGIFGDFDEQNFLQTMYRVNPQLDPNYSITRVGPPDANRASQYTYSLQGPPQTGLQNLPQSRMFGMQSPRPFGSFN